MTKKKILIIYATAGIGHKKAALAVKEAFDEMASEDAQVSIIDALDYTNAFFKWTYLKVYLLMVNKLPTFWGFLYYLTDNFFFNLFIAGLRRINNWLNSARFVKYLLETRPDVVISTHFFASEVISDLKKRGALETRLVTVVTDYRLHSWWLGDFTDMYVVGGEAAKNDLLRWKVPQGQIKILGIPAEPIFSKKLDRQKILSLASLRDDIFTILVIGGGFGVGPIEEIMKVINRAPYEIQVIAVCGHNDELVKKLSALEERPNIRKKVLGFVDNVYDYMEISDILISKSGGITVSESLAKEIPMIIISPIIGQETRNSDFLTSEHAALRIDGTDELASLLEDLASHPEKIASLREATRKIRRPLACYDVARLALDICREKTK